MERGRLGGEGAENVSYFYRLKNKHWTQSTYRDRELCRDGIASCPYQASKRRGYYSSETISFVFTFQHKLRRHASCGFPKKLCVGLLLLHREGATGLVAVAALQRYRKYFSRKTNKLFFEIWKFSKSKKSCTRLSCNAAPLLFSFRPVGDRAVPPYPTFDLRSAIPSPVRRALPRSVTWECSVLSVWLTGM